MAVKLVILSGKTGHDMIYKLKYEDINSALDNSTSQKFRWITKQLFNSKKMKYFEIILPLSPNLQKKSWDPLELRL